MSMRISTQQLYSGGTNGIQRLQSNLYSLQNQVSTGRRIVTPQDDPVGAAQALVVTQAGSVNQLYLKNQGSATTKLAALDSTLGAVNGELQSIYEKAIAAGNGSYSDSERAAVAKELEERLKNLVTLGNTQDGTGRYVFAGFQSTTPPFAVSTNSAPFSTNLPPLASNSYVTYAGDEGVQILQVSASQYLATNVTGGEAFMQVRDASGTPTGRSVFDAVQNMVEFLKTPGVSPSSNSYTTALSDISASLENISRNRAAVGSRLSSLESMTDTTQDRALQYDTQLSNLESLDYAKALTDVSQKKLQLEAAQATFATTAKLSLFDYI